MRMYQLLRYVGCVPQFWEATGLRRDKLEVDPTGDSRTLEQWAHDHEEEHNLQDGLYVVAPEPPAAVNAYAVALVKAGGAWCRVSSISC